LGTVLPTSASPEMSTMDLALPMIPRDRPTFRGSLAHRDEGGDALLARSRGGGTRLAVLAGTGNGSPWY
jgi:hypothetical protein